VTTGIALLVLICAVQEARSQTFAVPYDPTPPVIDGVLDAGEWAGTGHTITLTRNDGADSHDATLYFSHDGSNIHVGVQSGFGSGWDVYWKIFFDGDYSGTFSGSSTSPHIDISCDYQCPSGWSGYNSYWAHTAGEQVKILPPLGSRASAGSSNVTYEFEVSLLDLGAGPGDLLGFNTLHGNLGNPTTDYSYTGDPYDPGNVDQWATLELAEVPEPATLGLLAAGALALLRRRRGS